MKKRKDTKGIVLRTGESQRKDGLYQYRYAAFGGKRKTVYAPTLNELRKKEAQINKEAQEGIAYSEGNLTVCELVDRYLSIKGGLKESTEVVHGYKSNVFHREEFCRRPIRSIKTSDAKLWFIELQKRGLKKGTIEGYKSVLYPAFRMAVEEDMLRKNPFAFNLSDVVKEDAKEKEPLTPEQARRFISFCKADVYLKRYVEEFIILLGTGIRVGELCGLTKKDIDFKNNVININKQLTSRPVDGKNVLRVDEPKTSSAYRTIPMTDEVREAFSRVLKKRKQPKTERVVDGHSGFVFLSSTGTPKTAGLLDRQCQCAEKRYANANPDDPLPHITPHVFRHTFCTNMANSNTDVKALQYLMGHSNANITMNVYAHKSYQHAAEQFEQHKGSLRLNA